MYFGDNGMLYMHDESVIFKFDLDARSVVSIDVDSAKGWSILDIDDYGESAYVHYSTYPHNLEQRGRFVFTKGYTRVRNHVLPTGGVIPIEKRKAYYHFIEAQKLNSSVNSDTMHLNQVS